MRCLALLIASAFVFSCRLTENVGKRSRELETLPYALSDFDNEDGFFLTSMTEGGQTKIEAIAANGIDHEPTKVELDKAVKCTVKQDPEVCLYDFSKTYIKQPLTFPSEDLDSKITLASAKLKHLAEQQKDTLARCEDNGAIVSEEVAINNKTVKSHKNLIAYVTTASVASISAVFGAYKLKNRKKNLFLNEISPLKTPDKPIRVVVYNNIVPKNIESLSLKERFYKRFFGHTVLVVQPPEGKRIVVSYPEKDAISYWTDDQGFNFSELEEKIPAEQRSEFFVSQSAYHKFLGSSAVFVGT